MSGRKTTALVGATKNFLSVKVADELKLRLEQNSSRIKASFARTGQWHSNYLSFRRLRSWLRPRQWNSLRILCRSRTPHWRLTPKFWMTLKVVIMCNWALPLSQGWKLETTPIARSEDVGSKSTRLERLWANYLLPPGDEVQLIVR